MLSRISSWPEQKRLGVGVWCSPLIFFTSYAVQYLLQIYLRPLYSPYLDRIDQSTWPIIFLIFSSCVFWLACAAFAGLCTAFFWRDLQMDEEKRKSLTFRSVAITWGVTFPLCCTWIVLGCPYLLMFRFAVDRGITFWNSNRPRQWLGDFSDIEKQSDC